MKLGLYCLRDSKSGEFFSPACSYSDNSVINMYSSMASNLLKEHGEVKSKMLDSQIFKLGYIDMSTGLVESDLNYLTNLINLDSLVDKSEVQNNGV